MRTPGGTWPVAPAPAPAAAWRSSAIDGLNGNATSCHAGGRLALSTSAGGAV
jgi:hypothetical protein